MDFSNADLGLILSQDFIHQSVQVCFYLSFHTVSSIEKKNHSLFQMSFFL